MFDFTKQRQRVEEGRERARTTNDLHAVQKRFLALKLRAVLDGKLEEWVNISVQEAITYMHLYERNPLRRLYLDSYYGTIVAAVAVVEGYRLRNYAQVYRRLGDYHEELRQNKEALNCYLISESDNPEYSAPLGRALLLMGDMKGLAILQRAEEAARKLDKSDWHGQIVYSGVLLKAAEGLAAFAKKKPEAKKAMQKARHVCESLNEQGYPQRLIQWHRLNHHLRLVPEAKGR